MIRRAPTPALSLLALSLSLLLGPLGGCGGPGEPRLTLLISVDTLRADHLGAYGSERGLTPNLDALAGESQLFEHAFAPASFTVPSLSSVLTGLHPQRTRIYTNEHVLPESVPTLAELLRKDGHRTGAVVSSFVLRRGTGLQRGFDHYDDHYDQAEAVRRVPERLAPATTRAALAMIDALRRDAPGHIFLWVHYQDPHGPYTPPRELLEPMLTQERERGFEPPLPFGRDHRGLDGIPTYQRIDGERSPSFYRASYRAEIQYTDQGIGALLAGLRERGLWRQTLLVFLSDHGEGLGEDDYWFAHGEYLSDPLVRVPLMIRVPGLPGARHRQLASLQDVIPTLGPLLALRVPEDLPGRDLLATGSARTPEHPIYLATLGGSTVPRFGLVRDGFRYLVTPSHGEERLVALADEGRDLADALPERLREMRSVLQAIQSNLSDDTESRIQERTQQEIEHLRSLGYVE